MTNFWGRSARSHDLPLRPWGLVASISFALTFLLVVVCSQRSAAIRSRT
ncbi:hypothetical protein [Saccharopolyspora antimicrobica]|nr:hypothetical protein [Saccharopolyspora antimicrobica]